MTFLNEEQINSLDKKSIAMIIKTLQGQIMLLDTTNKSDFLIRDILVRSQKKPLLLMDKYLSLIIIQNYSMKQRFLRMILKNLISMKSPSLTKGKRNPEIVIPSLVAAILTSKYSTHVPLDRQARSFNDNGINIATNALTNWVINSSDTFYHYSMNECINAYMTARYYM